MLAKAMSSQDCDLFTRSLAYSKYGLVHLIVRKSILLQNLGTLQLYLSADAFATCASAKPPQNTLFAVERVGSISFQDMQKYMDLIVGLFELCPTGTWEQHPSLYGIYI